MAKDKEAKGGGEKSRLKESPNQVIANAVTFAVSHSRGAALIDMNAAEINQEEVVDVLPDYYHHVTIQDILEGKAVVPREKPALVVTGYSREFYSREEEDRIESFIRATANMRNLNSGEFSLLVLSDSLPNEDVFHNSSRPWFNGPFQGDESVWSIRRPSSGLKIELVQHDLKSEIVREPKVKIIKTWVDKQIIPFEPF